jgi:NADH dehydrogenase
MLASLGRTCAVAEICGFSFSGFFARWLWRTIYLLKPPGLERKVRVALDWIWDLFFARDIVLFKLFL